MLKLYHNDMSTCSQKVRFLLAEKGIEWEGMELDLRRGDQLQSEFLKINPKGLVPVLIHDGNVVPESNRQFEKLLSDMNEALAAHPWMVGDNLSLADIAYSPYVTRLDHLRLQGLWDDKPHFADWYDRLMQTSGYREGVASWFNQKYLPLMDKAGTEAWPRVAEIRDQVRAGG